jgi:ABC-type transport system involved in multi-copper enzyme maturation permease subunit
MYALIVVCFAVGVAVRATGCVVRERQRHTLDMLLTIPVERRDILRAKWRAAIDRGWPWLAVLGSNVMLGLLIGAYHPLSAVYLLLCPWPLVLCLCSLGVLFSVVARTALQARLAMACVLLGLVVWIGRTRPGLFLGFNRLTVTWWHSESFALDELLAFGLSATGLLLAAAEAWLLARGLFEQTGRR